MPKYGGRRYGYGRPAGASAATTGPPPASPARSLAVSFPWSSPRLSLPAWSAGRGLPPGRTVCGQSAQRPESAGASRLPGAD